MKQVVQNLRSGAVEMTDVPLPQVGRGEVLVATRASLISVGTERMMMDFAGKSLAGKAKERPDLVKKVVTKIQRDGLVDTLNSVFGRLNEPMPLGYSASGEVVAVGDDCTGQFSVGDRVAVAGAGIANHAEVNAVPKNLVVKLPETVPFEQGCYATLGAIALHGVRNAGVQLGDRVLVVGLGLVGQLVVQLAAAAGARVAGLDFNPQRCRLAEQGGAKLTISKDGAAAGSAFRTFTEGRGFDAILICAATDSDGPIEQAAEWARDRANVVLVGKVGTRFPYATYMKKELNVRVSRSYGPGRYDPAFEQRGMAYPIGFVPWTEHENLGEVARLMGTGALNVSLLTTHTFGFDDALKGYQLIKDNKPCLGVVLAYPAQKMAPRPPVKGVVNPPARVAPGEPVGVGMIGTGAFARGVILPALSKISGVALTHMVSRGGLTAAHVATTYKAHATTDVNEILRDRATHAVMIMTRHNLHAAQVVEALAAGKHVWVEKPLALTSAELDAVEKAAAKHPQQVLMVGFNRRFSPMVRALRGKLDGVVGPRQVLIRVNAGRLPDDPAASWQHGEEGGGRLLGEVCHFTDTALYLAGSPVETVTARRGQGQDVFSIVLDHADGSQSTIVYGSEGDASIGKERMEVTAGGCYGLMDNYLRTTWSENGKNRTLVSKSPFKGQDKGHAAALKAWLEACRTAGDASEMGKSFPQVIPSAQELVQSSRIILAASESVQTGKTVRI